MRRAPEGSDDNEGTTTFSCRFLLCRVALVCLVRDAGLRRPRDPAVSLA